MLKTLIVEVEKLSPELASWPPEIDCASMAQPFENWGRKDGPPREEPNSGYERATTYS